MKLGWIRIIDSFLPAGLQEFDHAEKLYRARMLIFVPFVMGIAHLASCIVMVVEYDELGDFRWVVWPAYLATGLLLASVALFRRRASFQLSAHLYALGATLAILCNIIVTGGFAASSFTILLPLVVVLTFILANIRVAVLWAGLGLLIWSIGVNLTSINYPNLIAERWLLAVDMITVINAGIVMMAILWFFDLFHSQLLRRLQVERDRALFSAAHDQLTRLGNRKTFERRLEQLIEHHQITGSLHAVLLIDLDDFKLVNDTYGHASGDLLLKSAGASLKACVRCGDLAARLGGDEFGVLLADVRNADDLVPILEKIHKALTWPISLPGGQQVSVGASIGAALIPENGQDAVQLLHSADQAMYQAKATSRGYVFVSDFS